MPRETSAFVIALGAALGWLWGILSVQLGLDTNVWPPLVAPLWITSLVAERVKVDPLALGATVSAACGIVPVGALFALARLRGA